MKVKLRAMQRRKNIVESVRMEMEHRKKKSKKKNKIKMNKYF